MSKQTLRDTFDEELSEQIESYGVRNSVLGLASVAKGVRVLYPTTIYQVTGDDTSGVAGLLMPNGEFLAAPAPRTTARYWEHEETLRYTKTGRVNEAGLPEVVGDSWTEGEVVWDGSVAGSINNAGLAGDETDTLRMVLNRREEDRSLTGEWASTGELYAAMARGTSMQSGRVPGKLHVTFGEDDGGFAGNVSHRRAA